MMNPESRDSSVGIATGNGWPPRKADNLTAISKPIV
jgi:hypothetical protein